MCGVLAGGVGTWNQALDSAFAIQQLLGAGTSPQVVHITNPGANLALAEQLLATAQATPQGKARIALAGALGDLPGWFNPANPEPAANDFTAQEANQFARETQVDAPFIFALRAELEQRAGGNPSWNTGVNYEKQLENSIDYAEVQGVGCVNSVRRVDLWICREIGFMDPRCCECAIGAGGHVIGIAEGLQRSIESRRRRTIVGGAWVDEGRAARSARARLNLLRGRACEARRAGRAGDCPVPRRRDRRPRRRRGDPPLLEGGPRALEVLLVGRLGLPSPVRRPDARTLGRRSG
jgi:hypothetical protein